MPRKPKSTALTIPGTAQTPDGKPVYDDDFKHAVLVAVQLYGGNVRRTAEAFGMPARTLLDWVHEQEERVRNGGESPRLKEKRGDIATKLESLIHSIVEVMPTKLKGASLSQLGVALGISIDKLRILRGQGLDPDPQSELARLLNINKAQLPDALELEPGQKLPQGFIGPIIDVEPEPANVTCADCLDTKELTSRSGQVIACPFCQAPAAPEPVSNIKSEPHVYRYSCSACDFNVTFTDPDLIPSPCNECGVGVISRDTELSTLMEAIPDDEQEN